jgi:hypothetical protein
MSGIALQDVKCCSEENFEKLLESFFSSAIDISSVNF